MPLQGHRAGVEPVGEELLAQRHDRDDDLVADGSGVAGGASSAWIDGLQTALAVAVQQAIQVLARQAIDPRCLGDREMTADDFEDNHPCLGHEPRLSPMTRLIVVFRRCHP